MVTVHVFKRSFGSAGSLLLRADILQLLRVAATLVAVCGLITTMFSLIAGHRLSGCGSQTRVGAQ